MLLVKIAWLNFVVLLQMMKLIECYYMSIQARFLVPVFAGNAESYQKSVKLRKNNENQSVKLERCGKIWLVDGAVLSWIGTFLAWLEEKQAPEPRTVTETWTCKKK